VNTVVNTQAQKLIARAGKEVLGVQALNNGSTTNIRANKGVILAAGGFQGSKTMQIQLNEKAYNSLPLGPPGLTGDGIVMGLALGADKINIEEVLGIPGLMLPGATSATFIEVPEFAPLPAILVNSRGTRYVDETIYYAHQNQELLRQETYTLEGPPKAFLIFDQALLNTLSGTLPVYAASLSKNLTNEIKEGIVFQASTIADLAAAISVDPTRFQNTINTWNTYSQNKADLDFGRTLGLGAIGTPPYYAIPVQSTIFDTSGGLKINGNAQVIDTDGNVIPRLYAAGTNSGGVIGEYYPGSGTSLNQGLTFGRIAGAYVATQSAWS
jgi:fumarate reductase flavoprotein subunit